MNKTAALFIVLGVLTAAALMVLIKPSEVSNPPFPPPAAERAQTQPAPEAAQARVLEPVVPTYEWQISGGKLASGPETVQVHEGENLALRFTSDHADELHLHGYDMHLALKPGEQGVLTLQASHSGRFEIELHHSQMVVTVLEVLPKQ